MNDENSQERSVTGIVTSRTCDCCGHHEIGMVTQSRIHILMLVEIFKIV
jgi:hypothetical protein